MPPFTGLVAYPITPLSNGGELDLASLARLVSSCVEAAVSGVAVLASSGAGVTFSAQERGAVVAAAVAAAGRTPVYAAVSAAGTREVLELARQAEAAGAAGLVLAPFSYLPLTEAEVRELFERLSDATELPLCFYNKPVQTHYDVTPGTLAFLAAQTRVAAVKDSMRRDNVPLRLAQLREAVGEDFSLGLSSDVHLISALPQVDAWHSGLAALLPHEFARLWAAAHSAASPEGSRERLLQLAREVAQTPHGIGALHAVAGELGISTAMPRGPFGAASGGDVARLRQALDAWPGQPAAGRPR